MSKKPKSLVTEDGFSKEIKNLYQRYYVYNVFSAIIDDNSKVDSHECDNKTALKSRLLNDFEGLRNISELEFDIRDNHFNIFHDLYFYKFFELMKKYRGEEDKTLQYNKKLVYLSRLFSLKQGSEFTVNSLQKMDGGSIYDFDVEAMENGINAELLDSGIITLKEHKKNFSKIYELSDFTMKKLLDTFTTNMPDKSKTVSNFIKYLTFATEFYGFGEIGKELLLRLENISDHYNDIAYNDSKVKYPVMFHSFKYKHNYIARCLCDFYLIDIMNYISKGDSYQKYTLVGDKVFLAKPLRVFTDCVKGVQYVTLFLPEYRSMCNIDISEIDEIIPVKITFGDKEKTVNRYLETAKTFIKNEPYRIIPDGFNGNLEKRCNSFLKEKSAKVILCIPDEKKYKLKSLKKDYADINTIDENTYSITLTYLHIDEVMGKLRRMYGFIQKIESEDNLFSVIKEDFARLNEVTKVKKPDSYLPEKNDEKINKFFQFEYKEISEKMPHKQLYNTFFSKPFWDFFVALSKINSSDVSFPESELEEIYIGKKIYNIPKSSLMETAKEITDNEWLYPVECSSTSANSEFKELRAKTLYSAIISLSTAGEIFDCEYKDNTVRIKSNKNFNVGTDFYYDRFPLTKLEAMWLKWVLSDCYADLFFSEEEKKNLIKIITENADVSDNIFEKTEICKTGAYMPEIPTRDIFQKLLYCTERHKNINIGYNGKTVENLIPKYMEFSSKNNQVWLVTNRNSFLLHKIENITKVDNKALYYDDKKGNIERICVYVKFLNNTLDFKNRFLSEFAPWKKNYNSAIKSKNGVYCVADVMYIYYYKREENEIYNRLLSYGGDIKFYIIKGKRKRVCPLFITNLFSSQEDLFSENVDKT